MRLSRKKVNRHFCGTRCDVIISRPIFVATDLPPAIGRTHRCTNTVLTRVAGPPPGGLTVYLQACKSGRGPRGWFTRGAAYSSDYGIFIIAFTQ